jgi:hypothetical protein
MQLGVPRLRLLLATSITLTAVAGGWGFIQARSLQAMRQERDALRTEVNNTAQARADVKKRECAQVAESAFHKLGYSDNAKSPTARSEAFVDHYSRKYDRCLVELLITDFQGGKETDVRQIYDVNERQNFGDYFWISSETKKYWEQKPTQCRIARPGQDETFCSSTGEWETYEREIMNS